MTIRLAAAVVLAALVTSGAPAAACGLDEPTSITMRRRVLNLAYPESLHVGTFVWQVQLAGKLPRNPLAQRGDLTPEARETMRLIRAKAILSQSVARLAEPGTATARPSFAVVLLGPVMWSRFEAEGGAVNSLPHFAGPELRDVDVVTDIAVVEALAAGSVTFEEALSLDVMRHYGPAADVAAARG